jgi:hypothetical protein
MHELLRGFFGESGSTGSLERTTLRNSLIGRHLDALVRWRFARHTVN